MNDKILDLYASIFKTLAHPTRIKILKLLKNGPLCVCEIIEELQLEQSNVSQHLSILRNQGIISSYRNGLKMIYQVDIPEIYKIIEDANKVVKSQINSIQEAVYDK